MATNEQTDLYLATAGAVLAIIGFIKQKKAQRLLKSGIRTEGIVFSIDREAKVNIGLGSQNGISNSSYPVIRFVTEDKEWVTQKYGVGGIGYKEGDKVKVIYNPQNVNEFILDDISTRLMGYLFWLGILMVAAGAALFAIRT